MIDVKESSTIEKIEKYSSFVRELFEKNESFSEYIWQLIVFDENIYIRKLSNKEDVSEMLERCVKHELETLQEISRIKSKEIKKEIGL